MAHHSDYPFGNFPENFDEFKKNMPDDQARRLNDIMAQQLKKSDLGATGKFPDGKLTDSDEGEIRVAIALAEDRVVMNFGKPIEWIGFTKDQAKQIAISLQSKAGFSMWNWMKGWLDAYDKENGTDMANSIMNWCHQQPMTQG